MIIRELLISIGVKRDRGSFDRASKGINQLKRAATVAAGAFAAVAGARGVGALINAASEANEQANRFAKVFAGAVGPTNKAIDEIAKSTKQSRLEIQGLVENFGAITKPALGSAAAAGKFSARAAKLALDLASVKDLKTEEALAKLRSGLVGSSEPLQSVGIDVRDTSKFMEDYAKTLGKTVKELTQAEKFQGRLNAVYVQLQATGGVGDAVDTADDYANASRALAGNLKEIAATAGSFLLPSTAKTTVALRDAALAVNTWVNENRKLIQSGVDRFLNFARDAARGLGGVLVFVADGWRQISELLGPVITKIGLVAAGFLVLVAILGLPVTLMLLLGAAILLVLEDWQKFKDGGESAIGTVIGAVDALIAQFGGLDAAVGEIVARIVSWFLEDILGATHETAEGIGLAFGSVARAVVRIFENVGKVIGAVLFTPIVAVTEALSGNFEAAARAISQGRGDIAGAVLDTIDTLAGGALLEGTGRQIGQQLGDLEGQGLSRAIGGVRAGVGAIAAGGAGNAARAVIEARTNVTVNPAPGQNEREIGRGIGEGMARAEARRIRQASAAVPGGAR